MKKKEVEKVLNEIRPHIQADGGDIELIEVDEKEGIVKVRLKGACVGCPMAQMTLAEGVGRNLKEKVKGVKDVVAV
ncbi:NifU family protein [Patescibacteria group bacterium]|nr:NifU family protein [Patescibacteria group bacterium]MBU4512468.1 NifU family protein [Patescibacteria group bacterium]MCG2692596.1 NifU family protein [Candidatus Parcubacteria bacterium]